VLKQQGVLESFVHRVRMRFTRHGMCGNPNVRENLLLMWLQPIRADLLSEGKVGLSSARSGE
jgi:hypothetical protein